MKLSEIDPDRFYSEAELDRLKLRSRSQRDRLRKDNLFPKPVKITPGRNGTLGRHILDMLNARMAEVEAKP